MKWIDNLKQLSDSGKVGKCPYCGSLNTKSNFQIVNKVNNMGFGDIWCEDCKKAFHVSRTNITEKLIKYNSIAPKELKY